MSSVERGLKGIIRFKVEFENTTGLLINMPVHGQTLRIGGADHYPMVVRRKYDGSELEVPLIPGSSLKGKVRSLLELALNKKLYTTDQKIWQHVRSLSAMKNVEHEFLDDIKKRCVIDELFGWAASNFRQIRDAVKKVTGIEDEQKLDEETMKYFSKLASTRLLVEDFTPSEEYISTYQPKSIADFLEEKMENRIDRITSAAEPRTIVRVKPGVQFKGSLKIQLYDIDRDRVSEYIRTLVTGLKLLEETYLGASGSRGYGRIKFVNIGISGLKVDAENDKLNIEEFVVGNYTSIDELLEKIDEVVEKISKSIYG